MSNRKTCRHWYSQPQMYEQQDGYRKCGFLTDGSAERKPDGTFVDYDDGYYGAGYWTGPEFGCVKHAEVFEEEIALALIRDAEEQAYAEERRRNPKYGSRLRMRPALSCLYRI